LLASEPLGYRSAAEVRIDKGMSTFDSEAATGHGHPFRAMSGFGRTEKGRK
jgi:hypothetical protein